MLGVELQQHLGVRFALEDAPLGLKLRPQFAIVIDLAVEGDAEPAVAGLHGLRAALGKIDDGEPAMAEARPMIVGKPQAAAVGPTRRHTLGHAQQFTAIDRRRNVEIGVDACYAAHGLSGCNLARAGALKHYGEGPEHDHHVEPQ